MVFNAFSGNCLVRKLGAHDMGIDGLANDPFQLASSGYVQRFGFASCGRDGVVKLWTVDCSGTNPGEEKGGRECDRERRSGGGGGGGGGGEIGQRRKGESKVDR